MRSDFRQELNIKFKTLNTLEIDGFKFHMSDNEVKFLLSSIAKHRPDIFNDIDIVAACIERTELAETELNTLKSKYDEIRAVLENIQYDLDDADY